MTPCRKTFVENYGGRSGGGGSRPVVWVVPLARSVAALLRSAAPVAYVSLTVTVSVAHRSTPSSVPVLPSWNVTRRS